MTTRGEPIRGLLCRLVPVVDADFDTIAGWLGATYCEELLRGTSSTLVRHHVYAGLENGTGGAALVETPTGQLAGLAHWWQHGEGVYEVGGATGDERLWQSGIGLEAALLLVDYLFEVLRCRRVEYTVGVHNPFTVGIGLNDEMPVEAVCTDYFPSPAGPLPVVKSAQTRSDYYQPYPHHQPRVGRRTDPIALGARVRRLAHRFDPAAVIEPLE